MILVTGADGQLGLQFKKIYSDQKAIFASRKTLDVTNKDQLDGLFQNNQITAIVNCAAYTAVDLAETNEKDCFRINSEAVENLAKFSSRYQIPMIQVSTDYVFDGKSKNPYLEEDDCNPLSIYGKSKLEGEKKFLEYAYAGSIIRTSWVYSEVGKNFYLTMSRVMRNQKTVRVVSDQKGTPTYALDLAKAIQSILNQNSDDINIYHFTNEGETTWYDFAVEIARVQNLPCEVVPISTQEYPTPAKRPMYSVLDKSKIKSTFKLQIRDWKDALTDCFKNGSTK